MEGEQQPEGRQVALPKTFEGMVPSSWQEGLGPQGVITCIPQDTIDGRMLVYRMLTEKGEAIKDWLNKEVLVTNFLMTRARFQDEETGEVVETTVTRLLTTAGVWLETHSAGIVKSLAALTHLYGLPPWPNGVKVIPKSEAIKAGRNWYVLKLVVEAIPARGKAK